LRKKLIEIEEEEEREKLLRKGKQKENKTFKT
jgi:hypothetical protein